MSPTSYKNVENRCIKEIKQYCPNTPIVIVSTKSDCLYDPKCMEILFEKNLNPLLGDDLQSLVKKNK